VQPEQRAAEERNDCVLTPHPILEFFESMVKTCYLYVMKSIEVDFIPLAKIPWKILTVSYTMFI